MTDYEKLKQIIAEIPVLISESVTASDVNFKAWKVKAERFLIHKFGEESYEYKKFSKTSFSLSVITPGTPKYEFVQACQKGLRTTAAIFSEYLKELLEEGYDENEVNLEDRNRKYEFSSVFIVHGHDGELKQSVARIIEKQGLNAVILSEQANQGRTIIEKFENNSNVGGAICLFTADDVGNSKKDTSPKDRARQNVVFEAGYFIGKLGRDHVVILADSGLEMPSDLSGIVYTETSDWRVELLKELKAMGYTIDFNKLF
jgi:predicted nucleotide-binding protein